MWVHWLCSAQHSRQLLINPTLHLRRQCGSDPNDQQRTKPKLKACHKNAQSRFGLVVWASEFGSFYFEKHRSKQTINWRIFWQKECSPRCNGIHYWVCGKSDDFMNQFMSEAFLANPSRAQLQQSPKQCLRWWHKPNVLTRCGINTPQRYWNQWVFWVIAWPWSNWAIMSLHVHNTRETFLQEGSSPWMRRGTSCRSSTRLRSRETKRFVIQSTVNCWTCMRQKFTSLSFCSMYGKAGNEHARCQIQHKVEWASRAIQGIRKENWWRTNSIQIPHFSLLHNERDSVQNRWMNSTRQRRRWTFFTPETYLHRNNFNGIINEIAISSKGPKGSNALFLQDAERNAAYVGKLKPGYLMYIGPGSKETWKFESTQTTHEESGMNSQNKLLMCILYKSIQSWKDAEISPKENWSEVVKTCTSASVIHF